MYRVILFMLIYCFVTNCKSGDIIVKSNNKLTFLGEYLYEVNFGDRIVVHWNDSTERIEQDSLFNQVKASLNKNYEFLANQIQDNNATKLTICDELYFLKKGDFAFVLLNQIEILPLRNILGSQLDFFELNCPYPSEMFVVLDRNRITVSERLVTYLGGKR